MATTIRRRHQARRRVCLKRGTLPSASGHRPRLNCSRPAGAAKASVCGLAMSFRTVTTGAKRNHNPLPHSSHLKLFRADSDHEKDALQLKCATRTSSWDKNADQSDVGANHRWLCSSVAENTSLLA
jgi:hypothetical protein